MIFLPDTNACISLLRHKQPRLIARWQSTKVSDIILCSIVVYELATALNRVPIHGVNTASSTSFLHRSYPSRSMTHALQSALKSVVRS
jgi:predicted nucleic acid-binding protein